MRPADLIRQKQNGRPITILTAWDSLSAALVEAAGADAVLVGDSLAMVALGHATTLPVTLEQMRHHTLAVSRGFAAAPSKQPLLICDLPFLSYQCGPERAVHAAGTLLKETPAAAVKLEGAETEVLEVIDWLVHGHPGDGPSRADPSGRASAGLPPPGRGAGELETAAEAGASPRGSWLLCACTGARAIGSSW